MITFTARVFDKDCKLDSHMMDVSSTGEHAYWDCGLQQAHVERQHLGQIQEAKSRVSDDTRHTLGAESVFETDVLHIS